jgi:hypothetical protein
LLAAEENTTRFLLGGEAGSELKEFGATPPIPRDIWTAPVVVKLVWARTVSGMKSAVAMATAEVTCLIVFPYPTP